jgi:putative ABC transport system permease protein
MLWAALTRRGSRAVIAALAVAVGVTTLTGLASIWLDLDSQLARQLRGYGANLVVTATSGRLSSDDLAAFDKALEEADVVGRSTYRYEVVQVRQQGLPLLAIDTGTVSQVRPYWAVAGALPAVGEVLVGRDLAETYGLREGDSVTLTNDPQEVRGRVAGVLSTGGAEDGQLVVTQDTAAQLFGEPGAVDLIEYSVAAQAGELEPLAERLGGAVGNAQAAVVKRLATSEAKVQSTLGSMLVLVSLVVLALTAITVASNMLALVAQRSTEIGLRKALGASDAQVRGEFLAEAVVLGLVGGVLGVLAGIGVAAGVSLQVFGRGLTLAWPVPLVAIAAAVALTAAASYPPVLRAGRVDPAVVLRGE